ncbi:DNA-binding transcriptional regulator, MarR family [bacterium A37T11]|nr:DNA-binding transcriptional regulator, MarR family [bacterium A37T11]
MDFYQQLGYLILGTRLRRLSEYFLSEVNKVYQQRGIAFEASWFPVFYILSKEKAVTIKTISDQLQVSHSAMSQLVASLKKKGWLKSQTHGKDARQQMIQLTEAGEDLLEQIKSVWQDITGAMQQLDENNTAVHALLPAIEALEKAFASQALSDQILHIEPEHAI